jgi:hypothetical protein
MCRIGVSMCRTGVSMCRTHRSNGLNKSMNASTFRKFEVLAVVTLKNTFLWDRHKVRLM